MLSADSLQAMSLSSSSVPQWTTCGCKLLVLSSALVELNIIRSLSLNDSRLGGGKLKFQDPSFQAFFVAR